MGDDRPFLRHVADRWSLGTLATDDLPGLAVEALERGFDSPKLRMLAGWMSGWLLERETLFLDALAELGVAPEPPELTIARLAPPVLADAAAGRLTMLELADVLLETFGPPVRGQGHPLHLLYDRAVEALHFRDEGDTASEWVFADLAREAAAKAQSRLAGTSAS